VKLLKEAAGDRRPGFIKQVITAETGGKKRETLVCVLKRGLREKNKRFVADRIPKKKNNHRVK